MESISDDIKPVTGLSPWLKYAGGKRWLAPKLVEEIMATKPRLYIEPFLGGGAIALALPPELRKILADVNPHLIDTWFCMQKIHGTLYAELCDVERVYGDAKNGYLAAREEFNGMTSNPRLMWARRSALFIYLNARCFNGLWRTNAGGRFNVPFGERLAPRHYAAEEISAWHRALRGCDIRVDDFSRLLGAEFTARVNAAFGNVYKMKPLFKGVCVFADPPYDKTFDGYSKGGFNEQEQRVLAGILGSYAAAGAAVWATNADTPLIREIYSWAQLEEVSEHHGVGAKAERRGQRGCLLIRGGAMIQ